MYMIVFMHTLLNGTSYHFISSIGTINYIVSQYLNVVCSVAVNCFVLISGYFLIEKSFNWGRVLSLWCQTLFYSLGFAILFYFIQPGEHSFNEVMCSLFPITNQTYWFVTDYFGLVCLAPFLSKFSYAINKEEYKSFLLALTLITTTIVLAFPFGNAMGVSKGFSLIWFITLFFWGGYIKRFDNSEDSRKPAVWFAILSFLVTLYCLLKGFYRHYSYDSFLEVESVAYNGLGFCLALPFFLFFKRIKIRDSKLTKFFVGLAPYTFGVYLIHANPHVIGLRNSIIAKYDFTYFMNNASFVVLTLCLALAVFIICVFIDIMRKRLFTLLRLDILMDSLSLRLNKIWPW